MNRSSKSSATNTAGESPIMPPCVFEFLIERLALLLFAALIVLQFAAVYEMVRIFTR